MEQNNLLEENIKEIKIKEKLYTLFYELTSEIKEEKIEIDEDIYEENLRKTSVFQIIEYIYQTIHILIKKYKPENYTILIPNKKEINQYENLLKFNEYKQRNLIKKYFQKILQIDSLEYKIEEYMEMEEDFEEMKIKYKYENGRFLENDRKDNEIIILRQENTNLKNIISNLERDINEKNKIIKEIDEKYKIVKKKLEDTEKELNLFSNIDINVISNINNNTNNSSNNLTITSGHKEHNSNNINSFTKNIEANYFYLCKNNINEIKGIDIKYLNLKSSKQSPNKNKQIHDLFGNNNKQLINDLSIRGNNSTKNLNSYYRNNSMNKLLDKKKINLISKYLPNKKVNKKITNSNNKLNYNESKDNNVTIKSNTCLKFIKKFPLNITQNGNLSSNRSSKKTNFRRKNINSKIKSSKKQVSPSKFNKNNYSNISMYNQNNTLFSNKSSILFASPKGNFIN